MSVVQGGFQFPDGTTQSSASSGNNDAHIITVKTGILTLGQFNYKEDIDKKSCDFFYYTYIHIYMAVGVYFLKIRKFIKI